MTSAPPTDTLAASPCIKLCRMDGELCRGCARTLDEITRWAAASEAERRAILALLAPRREQRGWSAPQ